MPLYKINPIPCDCLLIIIRRVALLSPIDQINFCGSVQPPSVVYQQHSKTTLLCVCVRPDVTGASNLVVIFLPTRINTPVCVHAPSLITISTLAFIPFLSIHFVNERKGGAERVKKVDGCACARRNYIAPQGENMGYPFSSLWFSLTRVLSPSFFTAHVWPYLQYGRGRSSFICLIYSLWRPGYTLAADFRTRMCLNAWMPPLSQLKCSVNWLHCIPTWCITFFQIKIFYLACSAPCFHVVSWRNWMISQ